RLDAGPLDRQAVVVEAVLGQEAEVLGEPGAEPVAVARAGGTALELPAVPVGSGRRALALRGRRGGAPPEVVGERHPSSLRTPRPVPCGHGLGLGSATT